MWNPLRLWIVLLGIIIALTGVTPISATGIFHKDDIHYQLQRIARPYAFNFASWELDALSPLTKEILHEKGKPSHETELRNQIKAVLADNGISAFPPITFKLENPPHLLVVSPRDRIFYFDRRLLRQELSLEEMEKLESQADELGMSSLVVNLGGFGATYPTIVSDRLSPTNTIDVVVEEWFHQYLAFRPLGFLYLLDSIGIKRDHDVVTMNETLAGMVSEEIGSEVYARYYDSQQEIKANNSATEFDFDTEMRETRRQADKYLSQGNIEQAERYMEERREIFVAQGYHIRKLNQAYFAFHGIYGQEPASVSPVYIDLKELRSKSPSLKHFVDTVAAMKNYAELTEALGR